MASTTVRVDLETHARLVEISQEEGWPLIETVRRAAEALWQQRFGQKVADQFAALQADPVAWKEYLAEFEATEVRDGLA